MTYTNLKRWIKYFGFSGLIIGVLLTYILACDILNIDNECSFHDITGLNCPTCGCSRMIIAIIKLDFINAIKYNAFVFLSLPFLISIYIAQGYMYIKHNENIPKLEIIVIGYFIMLIIFCIVRNIIPTIY